MELLFKLRIFAIATTFAEIVSTLGTFPLS